jgi:hypothetical protein
MSIGVVVRMRVLMRMVMVTVRVIMIVMMTLWCIAMDMHVALVMRVAVLMMMSMFSQASTVLMEWSGDDGRGRVRDYPACEGARVRAHVGLRSRRPACKLR